MAKIVLGLGTSHSPMLAQPPELWAVHGENDARNKELVFPPEGLVYSYEEALERADPGIAKQVNVEHFTQQHANLTKAIDELCIIEEVFRVLSVPKQTSGWGEHVFFVIATRG